MEFLTGILFMYSAICLQEITAQSTSPPPSQADSDKTTPFVASTSAVPVSQKVNNTYTTHTTGSPTEYSSSQPETNNNAISKMTKTEDLTTSSRPQKTILSSLTRSTTRQTITSDTSADASAQTTTRTTEYQPTTTPKAVGAKTTSKSIQSDENFGIALGLIVGFGVVAVAIILVVVTALYYKIRYGSYDMESKKPILEKPSEGITLHFDNPAMVPEIEEPPPAENGTKPNKPK